MEIVAFDPVTLIKLALLNPVVIVVAVMMGRRCDQWQKLILAAFVAAISGFAVYWLAAAVGLLPIHALGGEAALLTVQFVAGLAWAALGYWIARRKA